MKFLKWVLYSLVLLLIALALLFRISFVQTFLANQLASYASEKAGVEITIDKVNIHSFLNIELINLRAIDRHDSLFVKAKSIDAEIVPSYLWNNKLYVKNIALDSVFFALIEYKGETEFNLMQIVNTFLSDNDDLDTNSNFYIEVKSLDLTNSYFALDLQDMYHFDAMDYTHLNIDSINLNITDFTIKGDTLLGNIQYLSCYEKSGFNIHKFVGNVLLSPRELEIPNLDLAANNSWAKADLNFRYTQWHDWVDFIEKMRFDSRVDTIYLEMNDLQYFAPSMAGISDNFYGNANVTGTIDNLKVKKANVRFLDQSYFIGDVNLTGLPEIEQTFFRIKIKDSDVSIDEFEKLNLVFDSGYSLPEKVKRIGNLNVKGRFTGFYYDFVSRATFKSQYGKFSTDLSMQPTSDNKAFKYSGKLKTNNLRLVELLGTSYVNSLSMEATIDGVGLTVDMDADYNVDFKNINVAGYNYKNFSINGDIANRKVVAELISHVDTFRINAKGYYDFSDTLPKMFLNASLDNVRINRLFVIDQDTLGHIDADIIADLVGSNIDNIQGNVKIGNLDYSLNNRHYKNDSIFISSYLENSFRNLSYLSSDLKAEFGGFRKFSNLPYMYCLVAENVLPTITNIESIDSLSLANWKLEEEILEESIDYNIQFLNINNIVNVFDPKVYIAENSEIKGCYKLNNDSLWMNVNSKKIEYDNLYASNVNVDFVKNSQNLFVDLRSKKIKTISGIDFDSLVFHTDINMDTATYSLEWGTFYDFNNKGILEGDVYWENANSFDLKISQGRFYVIDTLWELAQETHIISDSNLLEVKDFSLAHQNNSLTINGKVTNDPNDKIVSVFNNFDVSFLDFYLNRYYTNFDGDINGEIEFSTPWTKPNFNGDLAILDFKLNNVFLNKMLISTMYSASREAIIVDAVVQSDTVGLKYLDLAGFYYPFKNDNKIDVEAHLDKFPLKSLESYLTSFSSNVVGGASGKLRIKGDFKKPVILGRLNADVSEVLIDYTQVKYSVNDYFVFTPTYFGFEDAIAEDENGAEIKLTTKISHDFFTDFKLHVDAQPINAELLNTTSEDNELFYGKASGNGRFELDGSFSDLDLKLSMAPNNKSYIAIPITSQSSAEFTDFLTFVSADTTIVNNSKEIDNEDDDFDIGLDMEIEIDPTTTIKLVMDEKIGDVISAKGNGTIKMVYDKDGNYNMYGKYNIDRGNYLFTMQGILNKRFEIQPGSSIVWDGDLENAKIDIKALYSVDAKLYDLLQSVVDSASSSVYKKLSKVECIINITGNLYNPELSFDILVPDESIADQELVRRLLSVEATGNSQELNKNFVSLLILGRFQPPSGYDAGANPNMLTHNATELLAEQVGNVLNQIVSDDIEIGLEWNIGDEVTTTEVAVALSYTMMDDRLVLDGKFGQGGGSSNEDESRIVADMEIAYKLTLDGRIRAKAFNRTNYYDQISRKSPYTQGVGITFRKDFNNFRDLFKSKKKIMAEIAAKKKAEAQRKRVEEEMKKESLKKLEEKTSNENRKVNLK